MRRSVFLEDLNEKWLHKVRGDLMKRFGKDMDITRSINLLVALGITNYLLLKEGVGKKDMDFEKSLIEGYISQDLEDFDRLMDEIGTSWLQRMEKDNQSEKKNPEKHSAAQRREGAVQSG